MFAWSSVCGARPAVMGIVNVTPDSFSDGGRFATVDAAVEHGLRLVADGADLLDVGGESTRPGAAPVGAAEEAARVVPVIEQLVATGVPVSVDTTKAAVAAAALAAGASVVNDVSAGLVEPELLDVVAEAGAGYVAMHMRGSPRTMHEHVHYLDVVAEVSDHLLERRDAAFAAGIARDAMCVDPGIGFAKLAHHNLEVLARLSELAARVEVPVLVGASRKAFLGAVLDDATGASRDGISVAPDDRDDATLATVVWSIDHGASVVRVHAVRPAAESVRLWSTLR
ncbi:MAG TPA: dihydropteroate synthase, partial [Acidimicrobiia bacterium]|nr:dihydropteroate synthase [Acidimicrobiia bacterium]